MLWLSGGKAGVKLRDPDRYSFIAGPTIEPAVVNVFQSQISDYDAYPALAHFSMGIIGPIAVGL